MAEASPPANLDASTLDQRLVRYADLRACTTAFIDTRTPGSEAKENFTIIGPGVAESPDQHVHISRPHGFNIGGARQPSGCINSQHSHETAEVFMVHSGTWAFTLGPNKEDGRVVLKPGDVISIPVHVFRGFENIGEDTGFLFAVLGGDDPGHVTWAPYVFDAALQHGLVLMEDGSLVDKTRGDIIPAGKRPMPPTTVQDVARLRRLKADEMSDCVVTPTELAPAPEATAAGWIECPIIGAESPAEGLKGGKMNWPHGFHVRHALLNPGQETTLYARSEEEVILVHSGSASVQFADGQTDIGPGDTLTVPVGTPRKYTNTGELPLNAWVVRGSNAPGAPEIFDEQA